MKYAFIFLFIFLSFAISLPLYNDPDSEHTEIYFLLFLLLFSAIGIYLYRKERSERSFVPVADTPPRSAPRQDKEENGKNLLQYLKESKVKPEIHEELFRLNQFLKELYTLLQENIETHQTEFLYDIDKEIPVEIVGDVLLYKQIFFHILSSLLSTHHVETLILSLHQENERLLFEIKLYENAQDRNNNGEYDFDYAQKLLTHINGELHSYPWVDTQKRFLVKIPFILPETSQTDYYKLPKEVEHLQLLLVEEKQHTAAVYTKLFRNFGIPVRQIHHEEIHLSLENGRYDIVLLDIEKYPTLLQHHLAKFKAKHGSKILAFRNTKNGHTALSRKNGIIDKYMDKPLTPGMVHDFLFEHYADESDMQSYQENPIEDVTAEDLTDESALIPESELSEITPEDFKRFGKAHVLIVEDNKINQKILENILNRSDLQISIANHGGEALDILQKEGADIILMDINMPVMDGYEATSRIRQIKAYKYLPIVVVSGLGYRNEIEKMYHIGADAHLSKPFKIEELYAVFENIFAPETQNSDTLPPERYQEDKHLLNTTKGLYLQKNILQFRDMLGEMMHRFNKAPEEVKNLLIKESYSELSKYLEALLEESKGVGAEAIRELVSEMKILSDKREEALLKSYLPHFNDLWRDTLQQIKAYLEHSRR